MELVVAYQRTFDLLRSTFNRAGDLRSFPNERLKATYLRRALLRVFGFLMRRRPLAIVSCSVALSREPSPDPIPLTHLPAEARHPRYAFASPSCFFFTGNITPLSSAAHVLIVKRANPNHAEIAPMVNNWSEAFPGKIPSPQIRGSDELYRLIVGCRLCLCTS